MTNQKFLIGCISVVLLLQAGLFFGGCKVSALYLTNAAERKPIDSIEPYLDVRGSDLQKILKPSDTAMVRTLTFNQNTLWPEVPVDKITLKDYTSDLIEKAKNPGLGVRQLHQQGITGKGVSVAIIDQALAGLNHPEYDGKIVYQDFTGGKERRSMHGPAIASLLVGTTCGTAPDAKLYFMAAASTRDAAGFTDAINWIIEKNKQLPASEKIRVVSVSAAPSGHAFTKNTKLWDPACQRAEAEGIMVLDCTDTEQHGFIYPCYFRTSDVEEPAGCELGFPNSKWQRGILADYLFVPCSPRTTAEQYSKEQTGYIYWGDGGLSWAIPYCAGVLAMGWQVRPDATPEQMKELLLKTAYQTKDGAKIINPPQFIRALENTR